MSEVKQILILGAGLVARPVVRYLLAHGRHVTVASRTVSKAQALLGGHPNGRAVALDIADRAALEALVAEHDLSVSLLPAVRHVEVAELCLKHGKHLATTSYISPAMRALDGAVRERGLVFLNECGVDPGIDHMSAMRIFDDVWRRGGRVLSFKSYCGGLPAPEANDNPLGYKFSWAPRGVLLAARNPSRYRLDGKLVENPGPLLFADYHLLDMGAELERAGHPRQAGVFEAYPNRDSLSYIETYGLGDVQTMYRGTLRNVGHCKRWKAWVDLGLFDDAPRPELKGATYACVLRLLLGLRETDDPKKAVAERLGLAEDADPVTALGWLGFYEQQPLPADATSPLDALAAAMLARMELKPGERDMLVMHHEVISEVDGGRERTTMDMVDFGEPDGDTSMARTVTLPLAIGIELILNGQAKEPGVLAPVKPEYYAPILNELEELGIVCRETTERL